MPNYSLSKQARQDIDEILMHIAADNVDAAERFNNTLEELISMIGDSPMSGRERPDLKEGMRYFPTGSYLVFYRIWAGRVAIVRVLHSARDIDEIFS